MYDNVLQTGANDITMGEQNTGQYFARKKKRRQSMRTSVHYISMVMYSHSQYAATIYAY